MAENENQPIIIVKKKGHGGGHHGGAWKVAYADFVTAMMALFIVLWVLGQSEDIKQSVAHYFNDPVGFSDKTSGFIGSGRKDSGARIQRKKKGVNFHTLQKIKFEQMMKELSKEIANDKEFKKLASQVDIKLVNDGLRIEMMDKENNYFFDVGSAHLKPAAKKLILALAKKIKKIPNKIVIEGHTDARKFVSGIRGYTNFELSADRANAARRILVEGGVSNDQIEEIRGWADHRLRDPKHPNSLVNRRISIIIKYLEKKS